jgi:predicted Zn-dependent protease
MGMKAALGLAAIVLVALLSAACEDLVLKLIDPPCYGPDFDRCQEAQAELAPIAQDSCAGEGRRVCLVPLGQVSPELVQHLIAHYQEEYGLPVTVMRPPAVPDEVVNSDRGQVSGEAIVDYFLGDFPEMSLDPNAVVIGLTPLDMYTEHQNWRFAFGVKGSFTNPRGVVSTFRTDPDTIGKRNDELLFTRARKMVTRYIGFLYYGLLPMPDPTSVLYESILSLDDLDRMGETLPPTRIP